MVRRGVCLNAMSLSSRSCRPHFQIGTPLHSFSPQGCRANPCFSSHIAFLSCSARRCTVGGGAGMWASISSTRTYTDASANAETTLIRLAMRWPTTLKSKFKLCFRQVPGVSDLIPVRYQGSLIGQFLPTPILMPKWSIPFFTP